MALPQRWLANGPLVADGAWGTELQKRGLGPDTLPDSWNLDRPELVEQIAAAYCEAGSGVILTNTFRSNPISLAAAGLADRTAEINRAGVAISRRAAGSRTLVFASAGPTGKLLLTGDVTAVEMENAFVAQCSALAEAGADAILLETMSDIEEAGLAIAAAKRAGLPVVVSFAFDSGRNRDRTMMGATPEQVARAAEEAGADAVGANCGAGIEAFPAIVSRMRAACGLPLWAKPNAGLPSVVNGEVAYDASPEAFAQQASLLVDAGASFVGGCCGTSPDFIRAIANRMRACA